MKLANVSNLAFDQATGVQYNILAYRKLTPEELLRNVRMIQRTWRGKKPKRGNTITVVSIIGHNEPV